MTSKQSLSSRLGILLVLSGLCAIFPGCVNKAQQSFERPPAPVVVTTAVSQDVLKLPGCARQDRRTRSSLDSATGFRPHS